jgi:hypothetical protein
MARLRLQSTDRHYALLFVAQLHVRTIGMLIIRHPRRMLYTVHRSCLVDRAPRVQCGYGCVGVECARYCTGPNVRMISLFCTTFLLLLCFVFVPQLHVLYRGQVARSPWILCQYPDVVYLSLLTSSNHPHSNVTRLCF